MLSHHYLSIRSILGRGCILEIIKTQFYSVNCACTYHNARVQLKFFLEKDCPESELNSWLSWWHDRRELIFRAFTSKTAPSINLAEVIHAGWKNRDRMGVSLLDACFFDVRDKLLFESLIDGMFNGSFVVGCGPSQGELSKIRGVKDVSIAEQMGKDILDFGVFGDTVTTKRTLFSNQRSLQSTKTAEKRGQNVPTAFEKG